jgi:RNA polymerase-binding transcription factor DksA
MSITAAVFLNTTEAFRSLQEGLFGECAECGGDIELKRLKAIPLGALLYQMPRSERAAVRSNV